jgi:hypothetical protein
MPAMANITVKAADTTTDKVYSTIQGSGADGEPALWRLPGVGDSPMHHPTLEVKSKWNAQKNARRVEGLFKYPHIALNSDTGLYEVRNVPVGSYSWSTPMAVPVDVMAEAAYQFAGLLFSSLLVQVNKTGFSPRG